MRPGGRGDGLDARAGELDGRRALGPVGRLQHGAVLAAVLGVVVPPPRSQAASASDGGEGSSREDGSQAHDFPGGRVGEDDAWSRAAPVYRDARRGFRRLACARRPPRWDTSGFRSAEPLSDGIPLPVARRGARVLSFARSDDAFAALFPRPPPVTQPRTSDPPAHHRRHLHARPARVAAALPALAAPRGGADRARDGGGRRAPTQPVEPAVRAELGDDAPPRLTVMPRADAPTGPPPRATASRAQARTPFILYLDDDAALLSRRRRRGRAGRAGADPSVARGGVRAGGRGGDAVSARRAAVARHGAGAGAHVHRLRAPGAARRRCWRWADTGRCWTRTARSASSPCGCWTPATASSTCPAPPSRTSRTRGGRDPQRFLHLTVRNDALSGLLNEPLPHGAGARCPAAAGATFPCAATGAGKIPAGSAASSARVADAAAAGARGAAGRALVHAARLAAAGGVAAVPRARRRAVSRPLRLLTLGHSYVVGTNRALARAMAQAGAGEWEVTAAAPAAFPGDLGPITLQPARRRAGGGAARPRRGAHPHHALRPRAARAAAARSGTWCTAGRSRSSWPARRSPRGRRAATKLVFATFQNLPKRYPPPFRWTERFAMGRAAGWIAFGGRVEEALRDAARLRTPPAPRDRAGGGYGALSPRPPRRARAMRASLGWMDDGPPVVGYLGRFVPEKGMETLMRALDGCTQPWRALLVGGGPMEPARARRGPGGHGDRVRIVTGVAHDEVPGYLNAMDLLCAPSRTTPRWHEQLGRMLTEAMACGVPVIGSASGEIPYVIADAGLIVAGGRRRRLDARHRRPARQSVAPRRLRRPRPGPRRSRVRAGRGRAAAPGFFP